MSDEKWPCDKELLERLIESCPSDIDVLVDIITNHAKGRTSLKAEHKKKLVFARQNPTNDRYSVNLLSLIAYEVQSFGGHSMVNAARRIFKKDIVSYDEVVNDVFKRLNGSGASEKSTCQKELEISLAIFGDDWFELSPAERIQKSTSKKIFTGAFSIPDDISYKAGKVRKKIAKFGGAAALGLGLRLNPAGLAIGTGFALNSLLSESYLVTIPFVAQMGWISLKLDFQKPDLHETNLSPSALSNDDTTVISKVELTDDNSDTIMTLDVLDREPNAAGTDLSKEQISSFSAWLIAAPGLIALAEQQRSNYVLCSLPYEALTAAKNGEGKRAFIRELGSIKENATLTKPDTLQNVLVSGAVWSVVSAVVAQKHLHDLNKKIAAINQQLTAIQTDFENTRRYRLEGMLDYTQRLLDHYSDEGIGEIAENQLEKNTIELYELEQYFKDRVNSEEKRARELEQGQLLKARNSRQQLQDSLVKQQEWVTAYLQVIQLRIITYALLYLATSKERYQRAANSIVDSLEELSSIATTNQQTYQAQIALSETFLSSIKEDEKQNYLVSIERLTNSLKEGPAMAGQLYDYFFSQKDKRILLRMENGQAVAGQLLE